MVVVAAVQHNIVWEDPSATIDLVRPMIGEAVDAGARLVMLSEVFATGFSMDAERIAEDEGGPVQGFLQSTSAAHGVWLCGSVAVRPHDSTTDRRPRNRFLLAGPNGELHTYDKIHPFTYGGEHEHYSAGDQVITVEIEGVRFTPFICYDLRFAHLFWDRANDTDCYLVPANWPAKRSYHWRSLLVARAIENMSYVMGVNRVGSGGGLDYAGDSMVIDPLGEVLTPVHDREEVMVAEVDPDRVRAARERFGFLADRKPVG